MSSVTDSNDTALTLTTSIFPDWAQGVRHFTTRPVQVNRSRSNIQQRISRSTRAKKAMEITVDGLNQAQSENLFDTIENRGRGALLVPWFPEGLRISVGMASTTELQLEVEPLDDWGTATGTQILVGTETREIVSIAGRVVTLTADGGATQQDAGTWVYPMRRAVLDRPDDALTVIRHDAARQKLRFIQITA